LLNLGLGLLLGYFYGGLGVVVGWVIALIIGSVISTVAYLVENTISWLTLLPGELVGLVAACLLIGFGALLFYGVSSTSAFLWPTVLIILGFLFILICVLWRHPVIGRLVNLAKEARPT
jgi:hypothetical protein